MSEPDPQRLAELSSQLATRLRDRTGGSTERETVDASKEAVRDLELAEAILRKLPKESLRQLSPDQKVGVEESGQALQDLLGQFGGPMGIELVRRVAAAALLLLGILASYFPTPGGPGTLPLIKVRCPTPGCGRFAYKRSHTQRPPICPVHHQPMT